MTVRRRNLTTDFDYAARARGKVRAAREKGTAYGQLWGIVDGAVADALKNHPDYLTPKGQSSARVSVVKRVTGTVLSFAEQSARGRSAAETTERVVSPEPSASPTTSDAGEGGQVVLPNTHCRIGKVTLKTAPQTAQRPRVALRAQRRSIAEREAYEATTAKLRAEITDRAALAYHGPAYEAVARVLGVRA